jgi:wobble nucleotide-excising tRNase
MIQKINYVKNLGLFRDFTWGQLQDFKRYNLIYGWNYSGKTTLSRVFQTLQHGIIPNDFLGCQFQATLDDNSVIGTHALAPYSKVRVFNRSFIDENFHPTMSGAKMIVVVGAENQKLKKRLGDLENRQAKVLGIKTRLESKASEVETGINNKAKDYARTVSELFGTGRYYNRSHFISEVQNLPEDCTPSILADADRSKLFDEWKRAEDYKNLNALEWSADELLKNIRAMRRAFKTTASYKAIERLKRDSKIENWVRDGLAINAQGKPCEFCGSVITDARWTELQEHFSKAYKELHSSVQSLIAIVSRVKCEMAFHDDGKFFPDLRTEYTASRDDVIAGLNSLNGQLSNLSAALQKKNENLESIQEFKFDFSVAKQLRSAIRKCNSIIKKHNDKVASAADVREEAKEKITKHHAAKYFTDEGYKNKTERNSTIKGAGN